MQNQRASRRIAVAAAAATAALLLAAAVDAQPTEADGSAGAAPSPAGGAPATPAARARVAIDTCRKAVERELLGKNPKGETVAYEGDSIYFASIEIIVNGALVRAAQGYDYTCRYNERSQQTYGITLEKQH